MNTREYDVALATQSQRIRRLEDDLAEAEHNIALFGQERSDLQARVAELEAALEAVSEVAGFIQRRAEIDPDAVNHATLAGIHNGAMRIEQIAAAALKAGAE